MTDQLTGTLENWRVQNWDDKEFIIWGDLYGDGLRRWRNGQRIHTSGILHREVKEGDVVQTRNSTYLLGKEFEND